MTCTIRQLRASSRLKTGLFQPERDRQFESPLLQRGVWCEPGTATTFSFLVGAGLLPYVVEDLVAGLSRNAERATDLAHRFAVQQPSDEPQALVHHRTLLPRHPRLPRKGERCYPCVRYDLSPMSRAAHFSRFYSQAHRAGPRSRPTKTTSSGDQRCRPPMTCRKCSRVLR